MSEKPPFKLLGNVDPRGLIEKVNSIFDRGWEQYCFDPGPPWNRLNKTAAIHQILLFSLPDRKNIVLKEFIYNSEFLNTFREDIEEVDRIYGSHYPNQNAKRITLNILRPYSIIPEHVDFMAHYEKTTRIHVPIITNESVVFTFPTVDQTLNMKVGEVVEFNNNIPHSGVNDENEYRVHMTLDYGDEKDPYYGEKDSYWKNYL